METDNHGWLLDFVDFELFDWAAFVHALFGSGHRTLSAQYAFVHHLFVQYLLVTHLLIALFFLKAVLNLGPQLGVLHSLVPVVALALIFFL